MTETNLEETKLEEENQDNGRNEGLEKEKEDRKENGREGRSRFWKGALAGSLVTAFVVLAAVGMAAGIWIMGRQTQETRQAVLPEPEGEYGLDMGRLAPKLGYMQQLIDQYYLFDEDEERENPEDWIYTGYVYSLQDPYSTYYTAEEYESVQESSNGEYCGIGVQVSQNVNTGIITVIRVFKDSPADKAGMRPGDVITGVGDVDAAGMDLSILVSDHIKGEEGTEVTVTVFRESIEDSLDLTMTREIVENPTVEYDLLEDNVGYISISAFEEVTGDQFKTAADSLLGKGAKSLIIDLRNNGGGVVTASTDIADYLLPDGKTIVSFKGKGIDDSVYTSDDGHEVDVPIILLVNGESASASEVLTGALKDNDWATIVGEKTFGKGIAQGIFNLPDGSGLKLTTAYYYTPSGECIHKLGIEPDVTVALDEDLKSKIEIPKDEDNQLQTALEVFDEGVDAVNEKISAENGETAAADDDFEAKVKENLEIEKEAGAAQ